jgi:hypothetical protein
MAHQRIRITTVLAIAIGAAACSSIRSLENDEPVVAYESKRSPAEILECISRGWSDSDLEINTQIRGDGYVVSLAGAWGPAGVAYITQTASGSRVKYAEQNDSFSPASWRMAVTNCQ